MIALWATWIFVSYADKLAWMGRFAAVFILLELLLPASKVTWRGRLKGVAFNLAFILAGAIATTTVSLFAPKPLVTIPAGADWWVVAAVILFADFVGYWQHRAMHAVPWLWRIHRTHHSITEMSAANSAKHWAEEVCLAVMIYVPIALLFRLGPTSWGILYLFPVAWGLYLHSAVRLHLGRGAAVLFDNQLHRLHHSIEPQHVDKNFGATVTLWDWLFRTLVWPKKGEWPETGVAGRPEPASFGAYLIDPLSAN